MRTDLAQYYNSTKPSLRLQYITSNDEKKNFQMNGTELMLRDINVFATTKANHRAIVEQLKAMAEKNNTAGASIYDLGNIMKATSISEIDQALKTMDAKAQKMEQAKREHEKQLQDEMLKAQAAEKERDRAFEATENAKDRQADLLGDQIKAAGYGAMQDIDKNMQSDFQDVLQNIQQTDEFQQTINIDNNKESNKLQMHNDKMQIQREKLATDQLKSENEVLVSQTNKNYMDKKKAAPKKK